MGLLEQYADADKLKQSRNEIRRFQDGGQMAQEQGAPASEQAPQGGGNPGDQIMQGLEMYKQQPSPELAVQIVDAIIAMQSQSAPAPEGTPAMRIGGTVKRKMVFKK